jgi:hypothetical protein
MRNATIACVFLLCSLAAIGQSQTPTPPPYCKPCLWYGGDFDPSNPISSGSTDQNTTGYQATTYVAFYVPTGQVWTVTGLFSNLLSNVQYIIPSKQIEWSISTGMSTGNPGTIIASGTIGVAWTATGRSWRGYTEYTALGRLAPQTAVSLTRGVYWMTAVPICAEVGNCDFASFLLSDVEDVPAPNRKGFQPDDDAFYNSPTAGYYYVPTWGPTGACAGGCDRFSAGLLGHAAPSN